MKRAPFERGVSSLLALAFVLLLACGCRAQPARSVPSLPAESADPTWIYEPFGWQKLDRIEAWLAGEGPELHPDLVAQAELELAEGRFTLARRERGTLAASNLERRLIASEHGFRRVLGDASASESEHQRARAGLEALELERHPVVASLVVKPAPVAVAGIQPRSIWKALRPKPSQMTKHRGNWTRITVHHSAKNTDEYPNTAAGSLDAIRRIQKAQMEGEEHMGDIAYHYLIAPDGTVYEGRSLDWQGAHALGSNNVDNIGVCVLGHFEEERPSRAALAALEKLLGELCAKNGIARSRVFGHQDLRSTICPGKNLMPWVDGYKRSKASAPSATREQAH